MPVISKDLQAYLSDPANLNLKLSDGEVTEITLYTAQELRIKSFDVDTA